MHNTTLRSAEPSRPLSFRDFTVAVFCALPLEANAVDACFTTRWKVSDIRGPRGESKNKLIYTLGRIGGLNVVLVHMAGMGTLEACFAAAECLNTFLEIKLSLIVGICGGVPPLMGSDDMERVLGDVIISDCLVQNSPWPMDPDLDQVCELNDELSSFLTKVRRQEVYESLLEATHLNLEILKTNRYLLEAAIYPGADQDNLYEPSYLHKHRDPQDCDAWRKTCGRPFGICEEALKTPCESLGCSGATNVIARRTPQAASSPFSTAEFLPMIHIGPVASGDTVMKSGGHRDRMAEAANPIAVEMEGAGVWQASGGSCVVIKGVCDYADSHKNKIWQRYAAVTAASCMVAFLDEWASER